jgi:predicted DNA binding CopG/RHH family protein
VLRIEKKDSDMKKSYAKSLKEYETPFELDSKKILAAMKRFKNSKKKPTSVALDEKTIQELKSLAEKQGIPYQVLIRVFILDGLERLKGAA